MLETLLANTLVFNFIFLTKQNPHQNEKSKFLKWNNFFIIIIFFPTGLENMPHFKKQM